MRPTMFQVHCNVDFFVALLDQAGYQDARAKLSALSFRMIEFYSVHQMYKRSTDDLRRHEQWIHRYPPKPNRRRTPTQERIRMAKNIGPTRRAALRYGQYVKRNQAYIERKISEWPELAYDEKDLRDKVNVKDRNRMMAKKSKKPRKMLDV